MHQQWTVYLVFSTWPPLRCCDLGAAAWEKRCGAGWMWDCGSEGGRMVSMVNHGGRRPEHGREGMRG
jgi:hypothetical protein